MATVTTWIVLSILGVSSGLALGLVLGFPGFIARVARDGWSGLSLAIVVALANQPARGCRAAGYVPSQTCKRGGYRTAACTVGLG